MIKVLQHGPFAKYVAHSVHLNTFLLGNVFESVDSFIVASFNNADLRQEENVRQRAKVRIM